MDRYQKKFAASFNVDSHRENFPGRGCESDKGIFAQNRVACFTSGASLRATAAAAALQAHTANARL